jgi:hypothetical protein
MMSTILPTRNEGLGAFFGKMQMAGCDPMQAWNAASGMIAAETDASPEAIRDFLDSRHGRHFADDVVSELAKAGPAALEEAIEATITRWQAWRIGRTTHRELGIPMRLPYLTGFVSHLAITGETTD